MTNSKNLATVIVGGAACILLPEVVATVVVGLVVANLATRVVESAIDGASWLYDWATNPSEEPAPVETPTRGDNVVDITAHEAEPVPQAEAKNVWERYASPVPRHTIDGAVIYQVG